MDNGYRNDVIPGAAGAEALQRPNYVPAVRRDFRGDVTDNSLGDVPLAVPAAGVFVWILSGFSPCSEPCGGGES